LIASSEWGGGHECAAGRHRREVNVVFRDLRGFTAFTESTEPEEAMAVLREYSCRTGRTEFSATRARSTALLATA